MCDDPQGGDSDDTGAGRNPSGPADETVEGIGGDPFPGADQAPPPSAAGSRIEGIPEGWQAQDDGAADAPAFEPLAARPEGSGTRSPGAGEGEDSASHASQVQIGTGHSGIFSPSDILSEASSAGMRSARSRWILAEDGSDLEEPAAPPAEADDPPGVPPASEGPADPDEWRDMQPTAPDEAASESIGFSAFLASTEGAEQPGTGDSLAGDSQGIGESTLEGLDLGAGATEARRAAPRDDGGAMRRQLIGVILGGMLALPVTQVILLWGFQRDPFQVTRHVPAGLRFLLPSKFRGSPRRDDGRATAPRAGLDSLAATVPDEPAAADGADGSTLPPLDGARPEPAADPGTGAGAAEEATLVVEPPPIEAIRAPAAPGPLGERVTAALEATDRLAGSTTPDADPTILVAWYRDLAEAAALLAAAERGPDGALEAAGARFEPLAERLAAGHAETLESLGAMWLASATRPSDGAVLVGRLEELRAVGPWWGGALSVGTEEVRRVSFLCRASPGVAVGERILVAGVIVDPSTMWVSAIRGAPARAPAAGAAADQ